MTQTRRRALKVLGAIGATCAFPFAGDELYGQHVHATLAQAPTSGPYVPSFFTPGEYVTVSVPDGLSSRDGHAGRQLPACPKTWTASCR